MAHGRISSNWRPIGLSTWIETDQNISHSRGDSRSLIDGLLQSLIMYFTIYMYYMVRVHRKRPYALHIHSPWYVRLIQHQHLRPPLIRTCTAGAGEGKSSEFQMSPISRLHQFIIFRAAFNYELSLFVVKNLCYIFMLCHSLYPGEMLCFNLNQ